MTTDRFYGGVQGRLQNLQEMLSHIHNTNPPKDDLVTWVIDNTAAESEDAVKMHLSFIEALNLVRQDRDIYHLDSYGHQYQESSEAEVLYNALTSGVKGFQTLLCELDKGPMTDEEIMNLLVSSYDECQMTTPGPALRHREWLQAIEYVDRKNGVNRITDKGRSALAKGTDQQQIEELQEQLRRSDMRCVPPGAQRLSECVYPAVQSAYPHLCNDNYRCEEAHEGGKDAPEWKHAVRNVQKQLADDDQSRVRRHDEHGVWMFAPRFKPGKQYRRTALHEKYDGMEQSGISPSNKVPVVFIFTGDTGELYGYEDEFDDDGTFYYTGEGQVGDQSLDRGNKALRQHQQDDRELHVFEKDSDGLVTYIGQYVYESHEWETLPDKNGDDRQGIKFTLRPIEDIDTATGVVLPEGDQNPKRVKTTRSAPQRNDKLVRDLKQIYNHTCQLCGDRRLQGTDIGYSNGHHIKPLGKGHGGPDVPENLIILCPNHHDDFDNGMLTVNPETLEITHEYEEELTGETVLEKQDHKLGSEFLAYHNQTIANE
ncbi:HNH endonuclease [Natrarchaeobius sp. A-rgal3]|uniref:HNH endonuclease n=1 Tax=Natrarchaeobius versutus TaxID=1679078 RepID=UPI00350F7AC5